jgi:RNA polymerase sigma-70 factor, ECF subfamily
MSLANSNLQLSKQLPRPLTRRAAPIVSLVTAPLPPPSTWTDSELLANLLARQGCAWVEFSRRFDGLIRNCMSKILRRFGSVLSSTDAEDAHAMLMDRLLANDMYPLRAYREGLGMRFSTWIGLLSKNVAYDLLRVRAQERRLSRSMAGVERSATCETPESLLVAGEARRLVAEQLGLLSGRDQTFVRLFYLERRTPSEVASEMSITLNTVYSKKHKLHARLQSALKGRRRSSVRARAGG